MLKADVIDLGHVFRLVLPHDPLISGSFQNLDQIAEVRDLRELLHIEGEIMSDIDRHIRNHRTAGLAVLLREPADTAENQIDLFRLHGGIDESAVITFAVSQKLLQSPVHIHPHQCFQLSGMDCLLIDPGKCFRKYRIPLQSPGNLCHALLLHQREIIRFLHALPEHRPGLCGHCHIRAHSSSPDSTRSTSSFLHRSLFPAKDERSFSDSRSK